MTEPTPAPTPAPSPDPEPDPPAENGGGWDGKAQFILAIGVLLIVIAVIAYLVSDKTWARIIALVTLLFGSGGILWAAARANVFRTQT
jgi:Flp pilus assembly protein TadB